MMRRLGFSAGAAVAAVALGVAASANAALTNLAVCQAQLHLTLTAGSYQTANSTLDCRGLLNGQPISPGGTIQMWGQYRELAGCELTWSDNVFYARIPLTVALFDRGELSAEGGVQMRPGALNGVTGAGEADYQPFVESGTATFTPDGGSCAGLKSGTLTQSFTLADGGDGDPAAATLVGQHLAAQDGDRGATAPSHHRKRPRHRHHHRGHRRISFGR
jgi:hypothetical protein